MCKILVCSSKTWTNQTKIKEAISKYSKPIIIHRESETIFENLGFDTEILANNTDGFSYLSEGKFDKFIAFNKNDSTGTGIIIRNAKQLGVDVEVIQD